MSKQNKDNQLSEEKRIQLELAAINLLQQVGVSFSIPLREGEIRVLGRKNKFPYNLYLKLKKSPLRGENGVSRREFPDPTNPDKIIEVYEKEIRIRPLFLETIDTIRAKRLELEYKDSKVHEKLENLEATDDYLLKYTDEMLEIVAIATINSADLIKHRREISELKRFYRSHLTNARLLKLVSVIVAMQDTASFLNSIRLVMGMGTTAPHEANRIEKAQSKE